MNAQRITDLVSKAYRGDANAQIKVTRDFVDMSRFHDSLLLDVKMLEGAISHGRLDVRADTVKYSGQYKKIIESLNATLDAVTGPLKMSMEYTDQLSRGILPPKITGICHGDNNQIKNNLNNCIDTFHAFGSLTRTSVSDALNPDKRPKPLNENSNFYGPTDSTAYFPGDLAILQDHITNTNGIFPGVISTINGQVSEIAVHNQRTKKSTTKLALDTSRTAQSAGVVHYHAGRGDEKVKEIFKGMKELSAGIQEISSDTDVVFRLTKKTAELSGDAAERAGKVTSGFTEITRTSDEVEAYISELSLIVDRIGDSTGHILTLSDRIKKQAKNASDENGKLVNFQNTAPVAPPEVTFLAEATRESAGKISGLVKDLSKKSQQVKDVLGIMKNKLKTESDAFNKTAEQFSRVAGSVEEINRNMEDVLRASKVSERSVMTLTAQVQNVNYVVHGTAEKASDVAQACKDNSSSCFLVAQDMADANRYARKVASDTAKFQKSV